MVKIHQMELRCFNFYTTSDIRSLNCKVKDWRKVRHMKAVAKDQAYSTKYSPLTVPKLKNKYELDLFALFKGWKLWLF